MSQITYTTTATATNATGNQVTVASTNNMFSGLPIVFTGNVFGGITQGTTYYIGNIVVGYPTSTITLTTTPGGGGFSLSTATGSMTATFSQGGQQIIPTVAPGEPLNQAFNAVNVNFDQIFAAGPVGSNIQINNNTVKTLNTNGNLILDPNGVGVVIANSHVIPDQTRVRNLGTPSLRWNTVYTQYFNLSGDLTVGGNLSVAGNIIEVGNITTDSKIIQVSNTATTTSQADGSGIVVGEYANIAVFLYSANTNSWTTNLPVTYANGQPIGSSYGNANVAAYLPTYSGNINNLTFSANTITGPYGNNGAPYVYLTPGDTRVGDDGGNISLWASGNVYTFDGTGNITLPSNSSSINYANGSPYGVTKPAGANRQIQFNNNNAFGASSGLTFGGDGNLNVNGGFLNAAAVVTSGRIEAGTSISATGDITTSGNLITSGSGGDITLTGGNISGANVITANLFVGDGGQLSNVGSLIQSNTAPPSPTSQTLWWDEVSGALYVYYNDGTSSQWVPASPTGVDWTNVASNIIPSANVAYSLGNSTNQWKDLWVSNSTIYINSVPLTVDGATLQVDGVNVVTTSNTGQANIGNLEIDSAQIQMAPGAPDAYINISPNVEGWSYLQLPTNGNANVYNTRLHNDAGNVEIGSGDFSNDGPSYTWYFNKDGSLQFPSGAGFAKGDSGQLKTNDSNTTSLDFRDSSGRGFYTNSDGYTLRSNGSENWIFGTNGIVTLPDNTNMGTIEGPGTFGFYNSNANTQFLIEMGPTYAWNFEGSSGTLFAPGTISTTGNVVAIGAVNTPNVVVTKSFLFDGLYGNATINNFADISTTGNISSHDATFGGNINGAGKLNIDGDSTIGGNLFVTGNINFSGNVTQITGNSGVFYGNAQTGVGALYAGKQGFTALPNTVVQITGDDSSYVQVNLQNTNHSNVSSMELAITADDGTDTTNYIDMGIAGSGWDGTQDNSLGNAVARRDGYLYVQGGSAGGNLILGTTTAGYVVKFNAGGPGSANTVAQISNIGILTSGVVSATGNVRGGNINTAGAISAAGNVRGAYILGDGGLLSNIQVSGSSPVSTTGNVAGGNLIATGVVSATGNITANYFFGNGSQLTGLPATYGNSNVVTLLSAFGSNTISTTGNISSGNLALTGNLTVNGAPIYGVPASYAKYTRTSTQTGAVANTVIVCNVSENTFGSDIAVNTGTGQVTLVAGRTYRLRGSIVGFSGSGTRPAVMWYNETGSTWIGESAEAYGAADAASNGAVGGTAEAVFTANSTTVVSFRVLSVSSAITLGGNSDFGLNGSYPWIDIQVIGGQAPITGFSTTGNITGGNVLTTGIVSATGNVTGNYILGNAAFMSGIPASYGNSNVATLLAGFGSNTISTTGNINAGNVIATNIGNIASLNLNGNASTVLYGNGVFAAVAGGGNYGNSNVATFLAAYGSNTISTSGNITAGNLVGNISITGNVTGTSTNVSLVAGSYTWTFDNTGNLTLPANGDILLSGTNSTISAAGNITGNYIFGNGSQLTGLPATYSDSNVVTLLGAFGSNAVSTTGNITSGNLRTAGSISATGNITVGNILTSGLISATGAVLSGSITTGPITSNNTISGNLIQSSNNITVGAALQIIGSTNTFQTVNGSALQFANRVNFNATGTSVAATGNINSSANISAAGNVTGGNLILPGAGQITSTSGTNGNITINPDGTGLFVVTSITPAVFGNTLSVAGNVTVSGTGGVSQPNLPGFRVYGNGVTSVSTTTNTNGVLNGNNWAVDYNQGSYLNSTTGTFTAPIAGLYQINLVMRVANNVAPTAQAIVVKNRGGTSSNQCMWESANNCTTNHFGVSTVSKLAAGDTLNLVVAVGALTFDVNDNWSVAFLG